MWTVAIDAGLRGCGVALFNGPTLLRAGYASNTIAKTRGPAAWIGMATAVDGWLASLPAFQLAIETQQFRASAAGAELARVADIIELQGVVGALVGLLGARCPQTVHGFMPAEWKGQVPKKVMISRIWKRLAETEKARVEQIGAKDHNTIDAIGIGLYLLGRLDPRRGV